MLWSIVIAGSGLQPLREGSTSGEPQALPGLGQSPNHKKEGARSLIPEAAQMLSWEGRSYLEPLKHLKCKDLSNIEKGTGWELGFTCTEKDRKTLQKAVDMAESRAEILNVTLADTGFPGAQRWKHLPGMWETRVWSLGRGSPGEGNGTPFQYSCLENPMDGGAR